MFPNIKNLWQTGAFMLFEVFPQLGAEQPATIDKQEFLTWQRYLKPFFQSTFSATTAFIFLQRPTLKKQARH